MCMSCQFPFGKLPYESLELNKGSLLMPPRAPCQLLSGGTGPDGGSLQGLSSDGHRRHVALDAPRSIRRRASAFTLAFAFAFLERPMRPVPAGCPSEQQASYPRKLLPHYSTRAIPPTHRDPLRTTTTNSCLPCSKEHGPPGFANQPTGTTSRA